MVHYLYDEIHSSIQSYDEQNLHLIQFNVMIYTYDMIARYTTYVLT